MNHPKQSQNKIDTGQLALLTALAVGANIVEQFIPRPLPFLRIGLSNAVILALFMSRQYRAGWIVGSIKVLMGSALTGIILSPVFFLAFGGTFTSMFLMWLGRRLPVGFGVIGLSIIGAVGHNMSQLVIARWLLVPGPEIFYLTPLLILLGIGTGVLTGLAAAWLEKHLKWNEGR